MSDQKETVIIVHETAGQSFARWAIGFLTTVGLIGIGVLMNSAAMQWMGAVLAMIAIMARAVHERNLCRMTVPEARKKLDEIEASFARRS